MAKIKVKVKWVSVSELEINCQHVKNVVNRDANENSKHFACAKNQIQLWWWVEAQTTLFPCRIVSIFCREVKFNARTSNWVLFSFHMSKRKLFLSHKFVTILKTKTVIKKIPVKNDCKFYKMLTLFLVLTKTLHKDWAAIFLHSILYSIPFLLHLLSDAQHATWIRLEYDLNMTWIRLCRNSNASRMLRAREFIDCASKN